MGAQRVPYGLNNDSQPAEHSSKATPTGQKKATKTIRTNIQEGQGIDDVCRYSSRDYPFSGVELSVPFSGGVFHTANDD